MAAQRKPFPRLFLARAEPFRLLGDGVFVRPPDRGDYDEWASLRARSRNFLTPWEPTWPPDALSRAGFRARIARYAEDWRTDQGYNFFIFRSDEALVGGLYGVSLAGAFFGESMFHRARDASKIALVHLVARLRAGGFVLLDTQFVTDHLEMFGAVELSRRQYHRLLEQALTGEGRFNALAPERPISGREALLRATGGG